MNTRPQFQSVFSAGRALLVVVHTVDQKQSLKCVEAATRGGADGCFLINHRQDQVLLRKIYRATRREFPHTWVGLNFLGKTPLLAAELAAHDARPRRRGTVVAPPNGLWVDNPLAVEHFQWEVATNRGPHPQGFLDIHESEISVHAHEAGNLLPQSLYFAGAGFKYQSDKGVSLAQESQIVARRCDVVTTSGDRTGQPPSLEKIELIRRAIGPEMPLAIASGIDTRNVRQFLPYVQAFLVATSITDAWDMTNADKVSELAQAIKG